MTGLNDVADAQSTQNTALCFEIHTHHGTAWFAEVKKDVTRDRNGVREGAPLHEERAGPERVR